jgi:hypothetical protein
MLLSLKMRHMDEITPCFFASEERLTDDKLDTVLAVTSMYLKQLLLE